MWTGIVTIALAFLLAPPAVGAEGFDCSWEVTTPYSCVEIILAGVTCSAAHCDHRVYAHATGSAYVNAALHVPYSTFVYDTMCTGLAGECETIPLTGRVPIGECREVWADAFLAPQLAGARLYESNATRTFCA